MTADGSPRPQIPWSRHYVYVAGREVRVTHGMQRAWERVCGLLFRGCHTRSVYGRSPDDC